jgi:hypothetical protein
MSTKTPTICCAKIAVNRSSNSFDAMTVSWFISLIAGAFEHRAWFPVCLRNLQVSESLRKDGGGFLKMVGPLPALPTSFG